MGDSLLRRSLTAGSLDGSMSSVSMQDLPNLPGVRRDVSAINPKLYKQFKASQGSLLGSTLEEDRHYFGAGDDHSLHSFFDENSSQDISRITSPFPAAGAAFNDISGRYSLVSQQKDRLSKSRSLPYTRLESVPSFVRDSAGRVSVFVAFFVEPATDLIEERSRKVEIKFYHEDNSIEIIEPRIENSGTVQGKFLKRHPIIKPGTKIQAGVFSGSGKANGSVKTDHLYTLRDMTAGAELEIYQRVYTICDCDLQTKQYFADVLHMPFGNPMPLPGNVYDPRTRPGMSRARSRSSTASVSSSTSSHGTRKKKAGFFEYDRKVLRFYGIWDSRDTLFGDVLRVKLHYTLADDLIEIVALPERNSGRDPLPTLLKKSVIMKKASADDNQSRASSPGWSRPGTAAGGGEERPYHWSDLRLGDTLAVASMNILLTDADAFTRQFYDEKQLSLGPPIVFDANAPAWDLTAPEETANPLHSAPGQLRDGRKLKLFQGMVFRFKATLHNPKEADKSRQFIIQFHLEDDTVQIREPPQRNTGHKGGIFLSRCQVVDKDKEKRDDGDAATTTTERENAKLLTAEDLYIGATVSILSHRFDIHDCDSYTFKYMEDNAEQFPFSNIRRVSAKVREGKDSLQRLLLTVPGLAQRQVDVHELYDILVTRGHLPLVKHEVCTFFRAIDSQREGSVKLTKVLRYILDL